MINSHYLKTIGKVSRDLKLSKFVCVCVILYLKIELFCIPTNLRFHTRAKPKTLKLTEMIKGQPSGIFALNGPQKLNDFRLFHLYVNTYNKNKQEGKIVSISQFP